MIAADKGQTEIIKYLISHKADVNAKTFDGLTASMFAMRAGHFDIVKIFNKSGCIPGTMAEAVVTSNLRLTEKFIAYGSDINEKYFFGKTPIMLAFDNNDYEMAAFLISKGADVNIPDDSGITPLISACASNNINLIELAFISGANLYVKDINGITPLMYALYKSNIEVIQLLLKHKAPINIEDNNGTSPITIAVRHGDTNIVKLLIDN